MGFNTNDAKSFEDMAQEQENAEAKTANTVESATADDKPCECTDENCDCKDEITKTE